MSSYVQKSALPKLKCFKCNRYLSHFPIWTHPKKGSVCGRCWNIENEEFYRNILYEVVAEHQKFPCVFEKDGCIQNLFPCDMLNHEKYCKFQNYECPTRVYNNCIWEGPEANILDHFEKEHPTFILRDGRFEVDFVNNHTENYLLSVGENLFIVSRAADSIANTFSCKVSYVGCNAHVETYYCILELESGNHQHKHSITFQLNEKLTLIGENIGKVLKDPISIIGRIEIREPVVENGIEKCETFVEKNGFDHLTDLECPVCMEYLIPPVLQCIRGHSICVKCRAGLSQCPTCEGEFQNTQNFTLEKIIATLTYPCKFNKCNFTAKAKEIEQHIATCIYGPFKCPVSEYEDCEISLPLTHIYDHIANNHYESLLELDIISTPICTNSIGNETFYECYIIRHAFQLFRLCFKYEDYTFYWAVQLIGTEVDASKYRFEIDIVDNNSTKNRMYYKGPCTPLRNKAETFVVDNRSCVYFKFDQIANLISYELSYRVSISNE